LKGKGKGPLQEETVHIRQFKVWALKDVFEKVSSFVEKREMLRLSAFNVYGLIILIAGQ
jgi:hypothetical protein